MNKNVRNHLLQDMSLFGNGLFGIERYSFETEKKSSDIEGRGEQLQTIKQQIRERRKSKDDPSIVKSKKKRKKLVESRESVVPSSSDIGISIEVLILKKTLLQNWSVTKSICLTIDY